MFSRGKALVQLSLQKNKNKKCESQTLRKFTIKEGKINVYNEQSEILEQQTHVESENDNGKDFDDESWKMYIDKDDTVTEESIPEFTATRLPGERYKNVDGTTNTDQNIGMIYDEHSDSDITIDYDDEVRDPDWKDPDEENNSETDENNNEPLEPVEPGLQQRDRTIRKRKNGKMKEIQKNKRQKGENYKGVKKNEDGKKSYCTERAGRYMCPSNCGKRCKSNRSTQCDSFTDNMRGKIFERFWKTMTWAEKRCYVLAHIDRVEVKQRTKGVGVASRRNYTCRYFLRKGSERVEVCQNMFSATLGMNTRTIYNWLNEEVSDHVETVHQQQNEGVEDINEPKANMNARFRRNKQRENSARKYLSELPKIESHYCRAKSKKMYLESTFQNKSQLYREYVRKEESEGKIPYNKSGFLELFDTMNLSIFKPKKDQCDTCVEYEVGNLDIDDYNTHISKKNEARISKEADKGSAIEDQSVRVLTMDLQSLLICPRLEASSIYYKRKLSCHNFTIYDLATHKVENYFWHEGEGELNANVFASCVEDYLDTQIDKSGVKTVIIYSDGCTYQNRNSTMSNCLLLWAVKNRIVVLQKYLERGHTQMECDSVHSVIERKLRKTPIYTPQMYVDNIRIAKTTEPKYNCKYVDHSFFNSYDNLNYYTSIRPGSGVGEAAVTDLRVLRYNVDGTIEYKLNHSDATFEAIPRPRKARVSIVSESDVPTKLYRNSLPIKKAKYEHLMQLKSVIPPEFHGYYDNLPHVS